MRELGIALNAAAAETPGGPDADHLRAPSWPKVVALRSRQPSSLMWTCQQRGWGSTVLTQTMPSDTVRAMVDGNGVPEKVAWVLVRDDRVLVTRSHGRDRFYFPGGHRELGESDAETLVREIDEELQATIDPGSMVHFGTFEIGEGHPDHGPFRMLCYTADHRGELTPSREIAEKAWFRYADRDRVSAVDAMVFDALHEAARLS